MNESEIIQVLLGPRWAKHFCVPRYTPFKWWECDVFEITKAGYFREYEIKISLADFRADSKKSMLGLGIFNPETRTREETPGRLKHVELSLGDTRGPAKFSYVAPAGLIAPELLPTWAGLIEIDNSRGYLREKEIIAAPQLHRSKVDPGVQEHARKVCYYRMHTLIQRLPLPSTAIESERVAEILVDRKE